MRRTRAVPLSVALGLAAACTATGGSQPSADPTTTTSNPVTAPPVSLSLLVFNVEYGGSRSTDAVMADLDADVVGVLESYNRLPEIAAKAGYPYYDVGLQILSKYPILEPSGADGLYALIEVRPGEAVALINTHLDYVQDGPNRLARGVPLAEVLAGEEEVRLASIQKLLPSATRLLDEQWPVLFTGDLNEPSHLDWTAATSAQHGGIGAVPWPVSTALIGAGLRDAYREVRPDPVTDPGNTWGQVAGSNGSARRIDFAYVGGPVEVKSSEVVGERGGDSVDRGYPTWTSDHRAVLSQLILHPKPIPTTIALSSRLVTAGDDVTLTYRQPGADGTVTLTGPSSATYPAPGDSGTVVVPTAELAGGDYRVDLSDPTGAVIATNELYVRPRHSQVEVTTDAATYAVGEPITVRWTDGPANRWDWIGVYRAGAADPERDDYLLWGYTGGHDAGALPPRPEGELVLGRDHQGSPWPLPAGRYRVHYLLTDQYESAGSTDFIVR
ncbi:endonuclease/exonuclease/phosphatase family protein [Nocardioides sp.]|uniref:endonuclease/exonuclease/phosphatase family protein n=1 Tax=Nocardioides sp. TaxID=35761 RepID=UPI003D10D4B4